MDFDILLLDAKELGRRLSIKPRTLLSWARQGQIPHYRLGALVRFRPDEVQA
jgi:excisionase family DNA binding protein